MLSPLHSALSCVALLALSAALPTTAEAAEIQQAKVKDNQGDGYRVMLSVEQEADEGVATVVVNDELKLEQKSARLTFSVEVPEDEVDLDTTRPEKVVLALGNLKGVSRVEENLEPVEPCLKAPCPWVTTTVLEDLSLQVRIVGLEGDSNARLEVGLMVGDEELLSELKTGPGAVKVSVAFDDDSDDYWDMEHDGTTTRWKGGVETGEDLDGQQLSVEVVASDADGTELDSRTQQAVIGQGGLAEGIGRVRLEEADNGLYRLETLVSGDGKTDSWVSVTVTDADGNALFDRTDPAPAGIERHYSTSGLTFSDPKAVQGDTLTIALTPLGFKGEELDGAVKLEVDMKKNGTETWLEDLDPTDALEVGLVAWEYDKDAETWTLSAAVAGEAASKVASLSVELESAEGNEIKGGVDALELDQEWQQFVQTFDSKTPISDEDPVDVDVVLVTDSYAGIEELDSMGGETGTGTVGKSSGFGKGTKESASQTSTKPQLL